MNVDVTSGSHHEKQNNCEKSDQSDDGRDDDTETCFKSFGEHLNVFVVKSLHYQLRDKARSILFSVAFIPKAITASFVFHLVPN